MSCCWLYGQYLAPFSFSLAHISFINCYKIKHISNNKPKGMANGKADEEEEERRTTTTTTT